LATIHIHNIEKLKYFCKWSELPGFVNIFFENNWTLDEKTKIRIYNRLLKVRGIVLYDSNFQHERNLVLNDGIVKVFKIGKE